jgi:integrase
MRFAGSAPAWKVAHSKVLGQLEIDAVLADLTPKSQKSQQALVRLCIFRLATFTGLRVSELCGLNLGDVTLDAELPVIRVRAEIAKCHKGREVPIFSQATVADLRRLRDARLADGATGNDPLICSMSKGTRGNRMCRFVARRRFISSCKVLGKERKTSVHHGRHTAASQFLAKSLPITLVRDMLGHSSISVTNTYAGLFRDRKGPAYNLDG